MFNKIKNKLIKWLGGYTHTEYSTNKCVEFVPLNSKQKLKDIKVSFMADKFRIEMEGYKKHIKYVLCQELADHLFNEIIIKEETNYFDDNIEYTASIGYIDLNERKSDWNVEYFE